MARRSALRGVGIATVCAAACLSTGCGPVISTYLIISAQAELDGAQAAQAEKYAVYEYVAATEYLAKAREEQGYADFGPAIDYAFKANELATKAKERADKERQRADAPEGGLPPDAVAPTPDSDRPRVIIEKDPSAGTPVGIDIVPVEPEEGTRPPK